MAEANRITIDTGRTRGSLAGLLIASLVLVAACLWFGDRQGFEGDGLAFVFGIQNLDLVGRDHVYRYHWQPLAYDVLHPVAQWLSLPMQVMPITTAVAALGLVLLLVLLWRLLRATTFALGLALVLLLAAPELLVTTLYFNTTALGLPFLAACLLALHAAGQAQRSKFASDVLAFGAGVTMALACLFRLDFAACLPFATLALLRWNRVQWLRVLVLAALGGVAVVLSFLAYQPSFVSSALAILGNYSEGEFPITMVGRLKVLVMTFGPGLVVLPLLGRYLWKLKRAPSPGASAAWPPDGWLLASMLPTLVPLNNLYSGKYLVPFIVCLIVFLADAIGRAFLQAHSRDEPMRRAKGLLRACVALLLLTLLIGMPQIPELRRQPLLAFMTEPMRFGTHDGPRTAGAYLTFARWVRNFEQRQDTVVMYRDLAKVVGSCERNVSVAMSSLPKYGSNEWSWGFLSLYLQQRGWKLVSYEPARKAVLALPGSARRIVVWHHDLAPAGEPGVARFDFDAVLPLDGEDFWVKTRRWVAAMEKSNPCLPGSPADR